MLTHNAHKNLSIIGVAVGIVASSTLIYMAYLNIRYNKLMIAKLELEKKQSNEQNS